MKAHHEADFLTETGHHKQLRHIPQVSILVPILLGVVTLGSMGIFVRSTALSRAVQQKLLGQQQETITVNTHLKDEKELLSFQLASTSAQLMQLQSEDQYKKNIQLKSEMNQLLAVFGKSLQIYEALLDLRGEGAKIATLEGAFAQFLSLLSKSNTSSASALLTKLEKDVQLLQSQTATSQASIPSNLKTTNTPPTSGYNKQVVIANNTSFVVDLVAGDLHSTKVQVETASGSDCKDACPVGALADFVARSGGYAGINGPYFCPAEYPSCAGKTNSYDTLIMNKNKTYFNSDNNIYSVVPAFIFAGTSVRLVKSAEAGRDSGVDAVIAAQPALVSGGEVVFGGDGDPKKGSRGPRSFIAVKESVVYIGVVRGATVAESALVMKALGMQYALNLDGGGSTAMVFNGKYIAGPGRQTPFGIVFVRR